MAGTSATLLARKWESALLVNVDNATLQRIMDNPSAMAAVERIEGWRAEGLDIARGDPLIDEPVAAVRQQSGSLLKACDS